MVVDVQAAVFASSSSPICYGGRKKMVHQSLDEFEIANHAAMLCLIVHPLVLPNVHKKIYHFLFV